VFVCGIINWEGKFTAYGNKASRDVSARDGAGIPSIKEESGGLEGNADGVLFISHDFEAFG
jgi:hypothetical protein